MSNPVHSAPASPAGLIRRLGISLPVCQAPVGSAATPALAGAVSTAGGLGMLALSWANPAQIRRYIRETRNHTSQPFGANFVLEWPQLERVRTALAEGVRIVSTFWGDPGPYVAEVHEAGGVHLHTVGSVEEAAQAVRCGVDVLVAQGVEAGGHVRGEVPLHALLADLRRLFPEQPLVASGGIGDASDVAAALAAGAAGVWLGTRFVCAEEANAAGIYQQMLVDATAADTVMTLAFFRGWPAAPHRVLRNSTVDAWERAGRPGDVAPGPADVVAYSSRGVAIERFAYASPTRGMTGDLQALALYAGTSVERIHEVRPARDLVRALATVV